MFEFMSPPNEQSAGVKVEVFPSFTTVEAKLKGRHLAALTGKLDEYDKREKRPGPRELESK